MVNSSKPHIDLLCVDRKSSSTSLDDRSEDEDVILVTIWNADSLPQDIILESGDYIFLKDGYYKHNTYFNDNSISFSNSRSSQVIKTTKTYPEHSDFSFFISNAGVNDKKLKNNVY